MEIERRRFTRYNAEGEGYEVFSRESGIHGRLKDISKGGLAYQYQPVNGVPASEVVDILVRDSEKISLQKLTCRTIYDVVELAADRTFRGTEIRLRGLEYINLSDDQERDLENLLKSLRNGNLTNH